MSLTLHFHPLSSFCQKVLVALYETGTAFTPHIVDLTKEADRAALKALWPIGKFPVLRDDARDRTVAESSIIIEYLQQHYPGRVALIPSDAEAALRTRALDRFCDLYLEEPMQKIMGDRRRKADQKDPHGVEHAKARLTTAYGMIEQDMAGKTWAMGDAFTMVDCGAAPALFYANKAVPFGEEHRHVSAYLDRLMARPSYARTLKDAEPYFKFIPT